MRLLFYQNVEEIKKYKEMMLIIFAKGVQYKSTCNMY